MRYLLAQRQNGTQKINLVSEWASLRRFTLPVRKLYASLFFPSSTLFGPHSATQPLKTAPRYSPAHRATHTDNAKEVSTLAYCHTLQSDAAEQNAYLLGPMNDVKGRK